GWRISPPSSACSAPWPTCAAEPAGPLCRPAQDPTRHRHTYLIAPHLSGPVCVADSDGRGGPARKGGAARRVRMTGSGTPPDAVRPGPGVHLLTMVPITDPVSRGVVPMSTSRRPRRPGTARALALLATALLGAGALTACGAGSDSALTGGDGPTVVASTTAYADTVQQVAAPGVPVEAVISAPTAAPHSYEASPADAARVAGADLVVYNGGGYDSFVDLALDNAGDVPVVRAVDEYARVTGEAAPSHDHAHD